MVNTIYIIVSVLATLLCVLSIQFKKKKDVLLIQFFSSICYMTIYVITGAWSGAIVKFIEEIKDLIFIRYEINKKKIPLYLLLIFLISITIVSIVFYTGPLSLLPLFINILLFISTYFKNPKYIRYAFLVSGTLWGLYNFYVGAYILIIGNILEILSAIISINKFEIKKTKSKKKTKKSS